MTDNLPLLRMAYLSTHLPNTYMLHNYCTNTPTLHFSSLFFPQFFLYRPILLPLVSIKQINMRNRFTGPISDRLPSLGQESGPVYEPGVKTGPVSEPGGKNQDRFPELGARIGRRKFTGYPSSGQRFGSFV